MVDYVVLYMEFCKRQRPSMYVAEVQKQLIENQVVFRNTGQLAYVQTRLQLVRVIPCQLAYEGEFTQVMYAFG